VTHRSLISCLAALTVTVGVTLALSPRVQAAVRAALVEVVIPSQPFLGDVAPTASVATRATGPASGTLGITNITVTNYGTTVANLQVFAPDVPASMKCSDFHDDSAKPAGPVDLRLLVNPQSTATFAFPTPLVFGPGQTTPCVAVRGVFFSGSDSSPLVQFNGFVN